MCEYWYLHADGVRLSMLWYQGKVTGNQLRLMEGGQSGKLTMLDGRKVIVMKTNNHGRCGSTNGVATQERCSRRRVLAANDVSGRWHKCLV